MHLSTIFTSFLLVAQALALPTQTGDARVDSGRMRIPDARQTHRKPEGYDRHASDVARKYEDIFARLPDIQTRVPSAGQYYQDLLDGEDIIPFLTRGNRWNETLPPDVDIQPPQTVEPVLQKVGDAQQETTPRPRPQKRGGGPPPRETSAGSGVVSPLVVPGLNTFAGYAAVAYCSADAIRRWDCVKCKDERLGGTTGAQFFEAGITGMQGFVATNDNLKTIIVSFRGSQNILNWINNLNFLKTDLNLPGAPGDVDIHSGFWNVWRSVSRQVQAQLNSALAANPSYTVTFTGHSLGGAVATVAALDVASPGGLVPPNRVLIYTHGAPRVGNDPFYLYLKSFGFQNVYRGVNYNDIVPHLPPTLINFNHILNEQWINFKGSIVVCDDVLPQNGGEDTNCANLTPPWVSTAAHGLYFGYEMGGASC
ncbi:hypothetical protein HDV05_006753 [Chytridiales sp. JEL 0842]|nr:hypothetical protein HDV05_006753 [Chytridiales sp. JEL 0842]